MTNEEFGKMLALICFKDKITKLPIILNTEQYSSFIKEYQRLKDSE